MDERRTDPPRDRRWTETLVTRHAPGTREALEEEAVRRETTLSALVRLAVRQFLEGRR